MITIILINTNIPRAMITIILMEMITTTAIPKNIPTVMGMTTPTPIKHRLR